MCGHIRFLGVNIYNSLVRLRLYAIHNFYSNPNPSMYPCVYSSGYVFMLSISGHYQCCFMPDVPTSFARNYEGRVSGRTFIILVYKLTVPGQQYLNQCGERLFTACLVRFYCFLLSNMHVFNCEITINKV